MLKYKKNNFGFSLIELSIVLIIIGLLVAGITSGISLIDSSKTRGLVVEVSGYKQAVLSFFVSYSRYPGDINKIDKFGIRSGYVYKKSDFKAPFNSGDFVPTDRVGPFVELFSEGVIKFKPKGNEVSPKNRAKNGVPFSNVFNELYYGFEYHSSLPTNILNYLYGRPIKTYLYFRRYGIVESDSIKAKFFKDLDIKMDDGLYNAGNVRTSCYGTASLGNNSYDNAINNDRKCDEFVYNFGI